MTEVSIPFRVNGDYAELSLEVDSDVPLDKEDLMAVLRNASDDVIYDLEHRLWIKENDATSAN